MAIKTILAGLSGGSANTGVTELACRLAEQFQAHLEALHVRIDAGELAIAAGAEGLAAATHIAWADELLAAAAEKSERLRQAFVAAATRHGLTVSDEATAPGPGVFWRAETGDAPVLLAGRARFFDLVVLGRSERVVNQPHTDAIEETLLHSGRPVLLAPSEPPAAIGERVAIGWNGSARAVRSVVAALPFLSRARDVVLLELGDSDAGAIASMQAYLHMHGIETRARRLPEVRGANVGDELLSTAHEEDADLLVLGSYSRSPLRQAVFGGTTRQVLTASRLPLLMVH